MALRPVPGVIGNGAENSVELMRAGFHVGSSGATGIVGVKDFGVVALPTPGAAVRVRLGTGVINSTYPGVFGQSYIVQEDSFTDVPVAATGSSGSAVKYVYVLIKDTQYGGAVPPSVENGPYNEYAVTTTLPSNQPYLLLARINQPASTATITNAMITDLREMANPRSKTVVIPRPNVTGDAGMVLTSRNAYPQGEWFPNVGGALNNGRYDILAPDYATRMQIRCEWLSIRYKANPGAGLYWVAFGPDGGGTSPTWYTQGFGWDSDDATSTTNWILHQEVNVRPEWRGTEIPFFPRANKTTNTSYPGTVQLTNKSGMVFSVRFLEVPEL